MTLRSPRLPFLSLCFLLVGLLPAQAPFVDVTESAGIEHHFRVHEGMFGGGVCVLDVNEDGFEDLYITGGMNDDVLYLNKGDGTFQNRFEGSGLELTRSFVTQGVVAADVNRDGWTDLFVTTITSKDSTQIIPRARNLLFLNQGDGTFQDATEAYGLVPLYSFSTGGSFGDFNGDGWPDLYVGNYFRAYEGELSLISDATIVGANQTAQGYLLRNNQGQSFTDVYEDYGLKFKGFGFGGLFTDFDNDGDQDLLVHHDFGYKATPSFFLENEYPRRAFHNVGEELDMDLKINAMGAAAGDVNEDGYLDYFITNIRFNRFMIRDKIGEPFVDQLKAKDMATVAISWGANFADFDQDGDLDLFVANGDLNPNCVPMGNFYYENDGSGNFTELGRAYGLNDYGLGRGSAVFDLENDGDLDIVVVNQAAVLDFPLPSITRIFRNDHAQGNWLKVKLQGTDSESQGLGSRVTVVVNGKRMMREIDGGGSSHLSQNSRIAHFGLGTATKVDSLLIGWIGGTSQILLDQPVNQLIAVVQPEAETPWGWSVAIVIGLLLLGLVALRWVGARSSR